MTPYHCGNDMRKFYQQVSRQAGGAIFPDGRVYFAGVRRQRGSGLGGYFGSIARRLIPFAKKYILPHAAEAIRNIATDVSGGRNLTDSLRDNAMSAFKSAGRSYFGQTGSGVPRKQKTPKKRKINTKSKAGRQLVRTQTKVVPKGKRPISCSQKPFQKKKAATSGKKPTVRGPRRRRRAIVPELASIFH